MILNLRLTGLKRESQHPARPALRRGLIISFVFAALFAFMSQPFVSAKTGAKRPLSLQDMMKFKFINNPVLSEKGDWVVYTIKPDRGNTDVGIYSIKTGKSGTIPLASNPKISKDGNWVAVKINEDAIKKAKEAAEKEKKKDKKKEEKKEEKKGDKKGEKKEKDKKKDKRDIVSMTLLETATGKRLPFKGVKSFSFSDDSKWLIYTMHPEKKKEKKEKKEKKAKKAKKENKEKAADQRRRRRRGSPGQDSGKLSELVIRHLASGKEITIKNVDAWKIDPASRFVVYSIKPGKKEKGGLFAFPLKTNGKLDKKAQKLHSLPKAKYSNLAWSKTKSRLGFLVHKNKKDSDKKDNDKQDKDKKEKKEESFKSVLMVWDGIKGKLAEAVPLAERPKGWVIPSENSIKWTKDEERMFFGFKPAAEYDFTHPEKKEPGKFDYYGIDQILEKRGVDVWHWNDPKINPNQKKEWPRLKRQVYPAVYFFAKEKFTALTDKNMPRIGPSENRSTVLGYSPVPYMRGRTWDGHYNDVYVVNMESGSREKLLTRFPSHNDISLSPGGKYVVYYLDKHWYLYDVAKGTARALTKSLSVPFFDVDYDYPAPPPGFGGGGWTENDASVLIYDKYDVWEFFTDGTKPVCRTAGLGRKQDLEFRIQILDWEQLFHKKKDKLLLEAYSHKNKSRSFYTGVIGKTGVKPVLTANNKWHRFIAKAKKADKILFSRENYREFPDLWVSNLSLKKPKKITNLGTQTKDFLWGNARLISWNSLDGVKLDGIVITPENYDPKKRYPVLTYYYRFFTPRMHRFNRVVINHRPCYPFYSGDGYVIFLPDIRFRIGRPGFSATKCLVPGIQKLIEMGIADPKAIGLHGHSWSGYQTAFMITQTDIFAAAVAGAPVSNMTSAYNGIRWGTGLARQFQYEKSQSRIGPSLLEAPQLYIENSPVFFADRINTPLLIQFGDEDGAVPWYQGIELYLMMRRLDKNCIFLQYNGEPHHLQKYPNKVDYTIKMKQFFDHHLKGKPAPEWMTKGVPYRKKAK